MKSRQDPEDLPRLHPRLRIARVPLYDLMMRWIIARAVHFATPGASLIMKHALW